MIKPELYKRTTDILYRAYFNDELQNSICSACAVGNIIAANMGFKLIKGDVINDRDRVITYFDWLDTKGRVIDGMHVNWNIYSKVYASDEPVLSEEWREGLELIKSTGYSVGELTEIELAFENADAGDCEEDRKFNGLMAVIDVLDIIHENADPQVTEEAKTKFREVHFA